MARFGSPWSSGWGSPENHFQYVIPDLVGMVASGNVYLPFKFRARSGLDQNGSYAGIYRNAQFVRNVLIPTADDYKGAVDIPWAATSLSILPLRIGHLADQAYADEKVARVYEGIENQRITLQFTYTPKLIIPPLADGGYTSNWALTGFQQGQNVSPVQGHISWGRLTLVISVAGGIVTVSLYMGGTSGRLVSQGSATILGAPFPVTMADATVDGTGLAGTVTISNTVANVTGTLDVRWPAKMQILRDTFDPPTTVRDTITFKGTNTVRWPEPADLGAGTYYYRTQPISDTGITGLQTASVSISTIVRPGAPSGINTSANYNIGLSIGSASWAAGVATLNIGAGHLVIVGATISVAGVNNANYNVASAVVTATTATTVSYALANPGGNSFGGVVTVIPTAAQTILNFASSSTGGATYRLYGPYNPTTGHFEIGLPINWNDIAGTAPAAGVSPNLISLPPVTGYPGKVYCAVRAIAGGVEEKNWTIFVIEYLADGTVKTPRPNQAGLPINAVQVTNGRTATFKILYNSDHEQDVGANVYLFVRANGGVYSLDANGEFNLAGAVGNAALAATGVAGIKSASIQYTFPADGYYYVTAIVTTAGNASQSSPTGYNEILALVSNDQLPAATGLTAALSRS